MNPNNGKKESRLNMLLCVLVASIILAAIVHGPRLLAYMSEKTGYHASKEEADYAIVPIVVGRTALHALIADTPERRKLGLSYRESLGKNQSMLFVFEESGNHGIWMKNMKFAIDIIWFDKNMKVIYIKEYATPESFPEVFEPTQLASFVLETNSGFVETNNITLGSQLTVYR